MTLQTASPTTATGTPQRRVRAVAAAGAALLAAALLAIGGWHVSREDRTSTSTTHAASLDQPGRPAALQEHRSTERLPTVYLVGSSEQAALILNGIHVANAIRESAGEAPLHDEVIQIASAAEEAVFWLGIHEADRFRDHLGLRPMPVVDLRTQGKAVTLAATAHTGSVGEGSAAMGGLVDHHAAQAIAAPQRVFLVGSEAGAAAVRQHAASGDQVFVVENDEDVAQVRAGLSRPGTSITDLRPGDETATRVPALDLAAFSDQEMYARWLQTQAAR